VVSQVDTACHHLAGFVGQLQTPNFPETFVIIDEAQDVTQDSRALGYLETLARQGRDAGVHVILAIPVFVRERVPSAMLRTDVTTQAIFHGQLGGYTNLTGTGGLPGVRPGELLGDGDAWLVADGKLTRLQVALTTDLQQAVREMRFAQPVNRLPADLHPLARAYWESKEVGDKSMSIADMMRFVNAKAQHGDKWQHPFAALQFKILLDRGMVERESDRRRGWKVILCKED